MAAKSSRVTSTALLIFCSASDRVWLMTMRSRLLSGRSDGGGGDGAGDRRADPLTRDDARDRARLGQVEDHHLDVVVAAQADRGGVGGLQVAGEELVVGELVELDGVGVDLGVRVVHAVH